MKIRTASLLALALAASAGQAVAQSIEPAPFDPQVQDDGYGYDAYRDGSHADAPGYRGDDGHYDYARVLRVVPVIGAPGGYPPVSSSDPACTSRDYAGGYYRGGFPDDHYYRGPVRGGTEGGRTMASVLGSVIGAVIGSQVGGGSARYATTAIGSTVGAVAGRQVYENAQRQRDAQVIVCGPYPDRVNGGRPYGGPSSSLYDVTYEYAGRTYVTRTNYDPGDRIRVRVEVRAE